MTTERVYIVTTGDYDDYTIEAVFSSRPLAEEYESKLSDTIKGIEEFQVDSPWMTTHKFRSSVDLKTGQLTQLPGVDTIGDVTPGISFTELGPHREWTVVHVQSEVSQEDCDGIALEIYERSQPKPRSAH